MGKSHASQYANFGSLQLKHVLYDVTWFCKFWKVFPALKHATLLPITWGSYL